MLGRFLLGGIILLSSYILVFGQNPPPEPTPTPFLGRKETGLEKIRRQDRDHDRLAQQTYANLYGQGAYAKKPQKWRTKMATLYRKPDKKEIKSLAADESLQNQYSEFLKEKNTGIFKLIPDQGCDKGGKTVNASPICLKYNFPGAGSSYSFRLDSYRIRRLSDITLVKNSLSTQSVFNGAIYVMLGDIPIQKVTLKTSGLGFLSNYKPVTNPNEALQAAKRIARGIKKDDFIYGRGILISKNTTFAMRSIAYRGKFKRSEEGIVYNELDFDKRRDLIVVFRIVEIDSEGSPTIVWKKLRETKSPKLKILRPK